MAANNIEECSFGSFAFISRDAESFLYAIAKAKLAGDEKKKFEETEMKAYELSFNPENYLDGRYVGIFVAASRARRELLARSFKEIDANPDGRLVPSELLKYMQDNPSSVDIFTKETLLQDLLHPEWMKSKYGMVGDETPILTLTEVKSEKGTEYKLCGIHNPNFK